ncbi:MAG: hypothetical protein KA384_02985 [Leptotrichiaceae bacterium]|nr:hypothetical protein [Leptotrichiaceae bacterium]MBP7739169.1 hypothetical protein [Leptotrichiaceae bacterium]MBP9629678.1 hypothetical protein [Leptotrichiaceae bacterium]
MTIKENVILKKRAYLDLIDKYHYAKIETDIQDGNIVNVKIIQNVRIDDKYLEENGYL